MRRKVPKSVRSYLHVNRGQSFHHGFQRRSVEKLRAACTVRKRSACCTCQRNRAAFKRCLRGPRPSATLTAHTRRISAATLLVALANAFASKASPKLDVPAERKRVRLKYSLTAHRLSRSCGNGRFFRDLFPNLHTDRATRLIFQRATHFSEPAPICNCVMRDTLAGVRRRMHRSGIEGEKSVPHWQSFVPLVEPRKLVRRTRTHSNSGTKRTRYRLRAAFALIEPINGNIRPPRYSTGVFRSGIAVSWSRG